MNIFVIIIASLGLMTHHDSVMSATFATHSESDRLDCLLTENDIEKEECIKRGCIWETSKTKNVPWCFFDRTVVGYNLQPNSLKINEHGFTAQLVLKANAHRATVFEQIHTLRFTATYVSENIVRFKIEDANNKRYEVPVQKMFHIPEPTKDVKTNYVISLADDFNLTIIRRSGNVKFIDTSIGGLLFSDKLLQFSTYLPTEDIYGFGENYHENLKLKLNYDNVPIFPRDQPPGNPLLPAYGYHPFYMGVERDGKAHGVFLLNSNAMAYTLMPHPALSLKTTGGILDFFVFVGDNPDHVVQLYTSIIGRPDFPAFWSLGFQLTRHGYANLNHVKKVIKRNLDNSIPIDVHYMDIDYMDDFRDFTYDKKNFAGLGEYVNHTKKEYGLRWAMNNDAAIQANHKDYTPFKEGYKRNVFVKWPNNTNPQKHLKNVPTDKNVLYGKVWPNGPAAFPDFLKNATQQWWIEMLREFHKEYPFDGLWIDMNEPSNFDSDILKCPNDEFNPKLSKLGFPDGFSSKTICMNAVQGEHEEYRHYDVHPLYGWSEAVATRNALREITQKRGFIVSRSTYVSSAVYTAHWLGDNFARWESMRQTVIATMEFSLFGFTFVGADICGFLEDTTPELCRRWLQLGAFYPFSRSHNVKGSKDQDPGYWVEVGHPEVTKAALEAFRMRYQLLHYLYTRFYRAHVAGETLVRPVLHQFPSDLKARSIDTQFMLGTAVMVAPFLYPNITTVNAYAPSSANWFKIKSDFVVQVKPDEQSRIKLTEAESSHPLLFKCGSIVPIVSQDKLPHFLNTDNLRKAPLELWVFPSAESSASGDLFFDDGESVDTTHEGGAHNYYRFELAHCQLTIKPHQVNYKAESLKLDTIRVVVPSGYSMPSEIEVKVSGEGGQWTVVTNKTDSHFILSGALDLTKMAAKQKVVFTFANKSNHQCFLK